jgi:hypothetical protein
MRKLNQLNLVEFLYAGVLTFLQEVLMKFSLLSKGKLEKILLDIFDRVSAAHFKLFFQMDIKEVCKQIQSPTLDSQTKNSLIFNVVLPFAKRQVRIQAKTYRLYLGEKIEKQMQDFWVAVLTASIFTGRSSNEISDKMLKMLEEKVNATKKAN